MYEIFGFYKFKQIKNIKLLKKNLEDFIEKEDLRGTIIISNEGVNGTISFKPTKYKKVKIKIAMVWRSNSYNNYNTMADNTNNNNHRPTRYASIPIYRPPNPVNQSAGACHMKNTKYL